VKLMQIEQTRSTYWADFVFYGAAILCLAALLIACAPHLRWVTFVCLTLVGLCAWSVLEYLIHRFVFHGLQPFRRWHGEHHARPLALICAPTAVTAPVFGILMFLPMWALVGVWNSCAVTLGLLCGYFAYALTHHAIHHWRFDSEWLRTRRRSHFMHHHGKHPCCYGVTSGVWDVVLWSDRQR